ncbi:hypothetical protein N431DRAFT_180333 [Stipitochalara longipes BDJ]|nr:hypothetical protein N431DRAFT_180333 [Stipitochalara longipes BDJ]
MVVQGAFFVGSHRLSLVSTSRPITTHFLRLSSLIFISYLILPFLLIHPFLSFRLVGNNKHHVIDLEVHDLRHENVSEFPNEPGSFLQS